MSAPCVSKPTTVGQAWTSCDHVIDQEPFAPARQKQKLTLDHPDDLDHEDALMCFDCVAAAAEPGKDDQLILIKFWVEKDRIYLALTDCLRFVLCLILLGAFSFGFGALYFSQALQVDTDLTLPDDDDFWQTCSENASVTVLGRELPYNIARVQVSVPKFVEVATISMTLIFLITKQHRQMLTGCILFGIAIAASLFYVLAAILDMDSLPLLLDPVISFSLCLVVIARSCWMNVTIRARSHAIKIVRRCPRFCFGLGFSAIFALNTVLVNFTSVMERIGLHPLLVVVAWLLAIRTFGVAARCVFCSIRLPLASAFAVFFIADTSNLIALRRYMLIVDDFGMAVSFAATSAVVEFVSNCFSIWLCIRISNHFLRKGRKEAAAVHIHLFSTSVISELLAEHVALHGCLGASLFMNHQTTSLQVPIKTTTIIASWSISFAMEICSDLVCIFLIVSLLPVSFQILFGKTWLPVTLAVSMLLACIHPHLIGLHAHIDKERYFC